MDSVIFLKKQLRDTLMSKDSALVSFPELKTQRFSLVEIYKKGDDMMKRIWSAMLGIGLICFVAVFFTVSMIFIQIIDFIDGVIKKIFKSKKQQYMENEMER